MNLERAVIWYHDPVIRLVIRPVIGPVIGPVIRAVEGGSSGWSRAGVPPEGRPMKPFLLGRMRRGIGRSRSPNADLRLVCPGAQRAGPQGRRFQRLPGGRQGRFKQRRFAAIDLATDEVQVGTEVTR
jgi:hypothetical protein